MRNVDLCIIQDTDLAEIYLSLETKPAVKTAVVIDQTLPPNSPEVSLQHKRLREKAEREGVPFYYGTAMCARLLTEGLAKDGETVVVCDRAAAGGGASGAEVFPADAALLKEVLETGALAADEPEQTLVLTGSRSTGALTKNLALAAVKKAGAPALAGLRLTLLDRTADGLSAEDRMILCAVLVQAGARTARFAGETSAEAAWQTDWSEAVELGVLPGDYGTVLDIHDIAPTALKSVFIGGTAGGNLSDLKLAAEILKGRTVAYGCRLIVAPASAEIYTEAADLGCITDIMNAGGLVINHCGSARVQGLLGKNETMVSNDLENAPGYAGFESSRTFIASTKAAAEAALAGRFGLKESGGENGDEEEERIQAFEGRCWKFGDDIDTDIIIPTQHLSYPTMDEIKIHAFEPLRPELAAQLREGDLIVAGNNFGCGSSREQAAEVLTANGVHCVIAKSFARIFFRNAINNGILLLECKEIQDDIKEGDTVRVDLANQQVSANGKTYKIPAVPANLYRIISDGGLVKNIDKKVKKGLL